MAKQSSAQIEKPVHTHIWGPAFDLVERRCMCGSIQISLDEADRRMAEWDSYFQLVRTTDSSREYFASKEASRQEKMEIRERARQRLEKNDYLARPSFPDPTTWGKYVII